jgi:hypothetical protein
MNLNHETRLDALEKQVCLMLETIGELTTNKSELTTNKCDLLEQQVKVLKDHSHEHKDESDCVYPYNPDYTSFQNLSDRLARLEERMEHHFIVDGNWKEAAHLRFTKLEKKHEPVFIIEPDCTCHNDIWTCKRHPEKNKGYKPPVPQSECEHQWEFICSTSGTDDPNIYETYRCQKCLSQESRVIKPTPSDEPKIQRMCLVCGQHTGWEKINGAWVDTKNIKPSDEPTISISRTTIEDAAQQLEASGKQMADEIRRAIGKGAESKQ